MFFDILKRKNNELISVIIPVYNVEPYVKRCIDTVLNQTYKNIEIIIVDDGSTDNSGKICDEYKNKDNRVIVIHKENGGLSDARNTGIENCKGKYIVFVDSDDYIETTMVEKLYNDIKSSNADISICGIYVSENDTIKEKVTPKKSFSISGNTKYDYIYNEYSLQTIVAWNKLYKRSIFKKIRYEKGRVHEDEIIICDILNNAKKISYMLEPLYYYIKRPGSISMRFSINSYNDMVYALEKRYNFFNTIEYDKGGLDTLIRERIHLGEVVSNSYVYDNFYKGKYDSLYKYYCERYNELNRL